MQEINKIEKEILKILYISKFSSIDTKIALNNIILDDRILETNIKSLIAKDLISKDLRLTDKGRETLTVVFAGGVFDIIHPGHVYTLRSAKSLGDLLIVVIARDSTVVKLKGKKPIHDENLRCELVNSLKFIDLAILGREGDIFKSVEYVRPNIIALGYDQAHEEILIDAECKRRGLNIKVVRLDSPIPDTKSTKIKELLGNSIYRF
jgi:cytidyltransferase-like protein